ncbi:MAG: aldehyde dehydrogenase family protein [Gammaproteobacteria bacterium]
MFDPLKQADEILHRAAMAAGVFEMYDQQQTDSIVKAVYEAGFNNRVKLAKMAYEETGLGVWEHKVLKNVLATQLVYENIAHEKTVGIIAEDDLTGITEIAQPLGPILAVIPVTNPTATTLFKIMIALKTRNPIMISPHFKAAGCCAETAKICYEAALRADAPEDCIQWVTEPTKELTHALMGHPDTALLLATGGPGLVKAAYSSGTPAIGVGPGNVPVFIDESADIRFAVENIIFSKTFDNGTICASEQAVIVEQKIGGKVKEEFAKQGCYFMNREEISKIEAIAVNSATGLMSAAIVGQPVGKIAELAGINPPADTKILMAELDKVGHDQPLSGEILAPILAFYQKEDFNSAIKLCIELNYFGGLGHTVSIYANNEERIRHFALLMNAGRIVVNTPSSHGAVGGLFNRLNTSFTLGCGTWGKNITTENITAHHLINIKRICRKRRNEKWFGFPKEKYLDENLTGEMIIDEYNRNY